VPVNLVIVTVDVVCVLAATALTWFTARSCRASGTPYLLGIPAGFGLLTVSFAAEALTALALPNTPILGQSLLFAFLLTQTYGFLFLAFTYARRTRLRFVGGSSMGVFASAVGVTVLLLGSILADGLPMQTNSIPLGSQLLARVVAICAILYVIYETGRNWSFTRKASEGFVSIAFVFFLVAQLGFALSLVNVGDEATFLGYEGRVLGLFILNAILYVGVKPDDFMSTLKRLGLVAPAH
jgi:hypothetical protein